MENLCLFLSFCNCAFQIKINPKRKICWLELPYPMLEHQDLAPSSCFWFQLPGTVDPGRWGNGSSTWFLSDGSPRLSSLLQLWAHSSCCKHVGSEPAGGSSLSVSSASGMWGESAEWHSVLCMMQQVKLSTLASYIRARGQVSLIPGCSASYPPPSKYV